MKKAVFSKRASASITDGLIVGPLLLGLSFYLLPDVSLEEFAAITDEEAAKFGYRLFFLSLVNLAYFSSEYFFAKTPGKALHGLEIRSNEGNEASQKELFIRWFLKNGFNALNLFLGLLGLQFAIFHTIASIWGLVFFVGLFLAFGASRQCLHDKMSGTAVYKLAKKGVPEKQDAINSIIVPEGTSA